MPEVLAAPAISSQTVGEGAAASMNSAATLKLLAYVHLRNIHASTGAGRVARQLIEHLAQRRDVDLRILADPRDHARILPLVGDPWNHFDYRFFSSETSRQQARWFLLDRPRAESFWPAAQVVFCTAESYVPTKRGRLAVTLHDAAYFEQDAHRRDQSFSAQRLKWQLLYRKLIRKADLFHTVSHFSADRLGHFFPAIRSRLRVVHNAVTRHFFEPVTALGSSYLRETGLENRRFVLVPGGLHFRKNAELVLAGWPLLRSLYPDLTLAVVNHSHPAYVDRVKSLGGNFHMLGFVSDDALRALYGAAQVVWFPSRYEGFGLPVVEAMACGAPVVTSNASSLPEIAGNAALLAPPDSPQAHVDAIEGLLQDESLRSDFAARGKLRSLDFTWPRAALQLKQYFEGLL